MTKADWLNLLQSVLSAVIVAAIAWFKVKNETTPIKEKLHAIATDINGHVAETIRLQVKDGVAAALPAALAEALKNALAEKK